MGLDFLLDNTDRSNKYIGDVWPTNAPNNPKIVY